MIVRLVYLVAVRVLGWLALLARRRSSLIVEVPVRLGGGHIGRAPAISWCPARDPWVSDENERVRARKI